MLCKAAVMEDRPGFQAIQGAAEPADAKALGRNISGFEQEKWDYVVHEVAFQCFLNQNFDKTPGLRDLLLSTQGKVLVEAAKNDRIWGVGLDANDPGIWDPSKWEGTEYPRECIDAAGARRSWAGA